MTQPEESIPTIESDERGLRAGLMVLIVLALGLVLPALPERLGVAEAGHLIRLLGPEAGRETIPVETGWSLVVGTMERPARLLGILSAGLALALLLLSGRGLGPRGRTAALLALAALPLFWTSALTIGGGGWALAAGAVWLALLRFVGMPMPAAALVGGAMSPLLHRFGPGAAELPADLLDRIASALPIEFVGLTPGFAAGLLAAIWLLIVFFCRGRAVLPLVTILVVAAPALLVGFEIVEPGPLGTGLVAGLPALALALGWAVEESGRRGLLAALVVLVLLSATGPVVERFGAAHDDRARLDAAAQLVPEAGWLALLGERGPVLRYYEMVGHRVPGRSYLIRGEEEQRALVSAALVDRPPMLLLADPQEEIVTGLLGSYRRVEDEAVPEGFVLLLYGRGN